MARALVVGASGGIGQSLVQELIKRGEHVTTLSRSVDGLDLTDEISIRDTLGRIDGPFELIVIATGALEIGAHGPEKSILALDQSEIAAQFAINATGPALVLKHVLRHIPRDRRSVFVALSARVGSIGDNRLGGWYSYRAAKATLNQLIHTAAIEVARSHKQAICVTLHPGTVATAFTEKYQPRAAVPADEAATSVLSVVERLKPSDTGRFFDWTGAEVAWRNGTTVISWFDGYNIICKAIIQR